MDFVPRDDLGRYTARVAGAQQEIASLVLWVTSVFRPEDGNRKAAHRYADPITSARPPGSVVQS